MEVQPPKIRIGPTAWRDGRDVISPLHPGLTSLGFTRVSDVSCHIPFETDCLVLQKPTSELTFRKARISTNQSSNFRLFIVVLTTTRLPSEGLKPCQTHLVVPGGRVQRQHSANKVHASGYLTTLQGELAALLIDERVFCSVISLRLQSEAQRLKSSSKQTRL